MQANGRLQEPSSQTSRPALAPATIGYAQDRPHGWVPSAVQALKRDGLVLKELVGLGAELPCRWARAIAECLARGECGGVVIFCHDPGLVCCVANKVAGLRAIPVCTVGQ